MNFTPRLRPLHLGLTGGIGSGKSTVASFLAAAGAVVVDADALAQASTAAGGEAIEAIRRAFGPEYLDAQGAMDRERMRSRVFSDPDARAQLESIIHPIVLRHIERHTQSAQTQSSALLVLDIPLLVESGRWAPQLDAIVVVDCTTETQIARVVQRSSMAREQVQAIVNAQAGRQERRRTADAVLFNDGLSLAQLGAETKALAQMFGL